MMFKHVENEARKEKVLEATSAVNPMTQPPLRVLVTQSCPTLCNPMDCRSPSSSVHGILQATHFRLEWLPFPSPGDHPDPGIKPRSPTLQADSLPSEPPGKPPRVCRKGIQKGEEKIEGAKKTNKLTYQVILVDAAAAAAKSLQSCPTLCDPIDGSPPGSPVPGILQARTLEWVAISFSNP